jgi:hypothetical protein
VSSILLEGGTDRDKEGEERERERAEKRRIIKKFH